MKDATSDPEQVKAYWDEAPDSNIAIATGSGAYDDCGLLALDTVELDERQEALAELEELGNRLPATLTQEMSFGRKRYFLSVPAGEQVGSGVALNWFDVKWEGDYILVPPSCRLGGQEHRWADKNPIATAPGWLLAKLRKPSERHKGDWRRLEFRAYCLIRESN